MTGSAKSVLIPSVCERTGSVLAAYADDVACLALVQRPQGQHNHNSISINRQGQYKHTSISVNRQGQYNHASISVNRQGQPGVSMLLFLLIAKGSLA